MLITFGIFPRSRYIERASLLRARVFKTTRYCLERYVKALDDMLVAMLISTVMKNLRSLDNFQSMSTKWSGIKVSVWRLNCRSGFQNITAKQTNRL